jgi:parallel beta-helix repeat protein
VRPRLEALEGRWAPAVLTVTTAADSGPGSLRQALLDANAAPGLDTVNFGIGSGAQTIALSSPLPAVTDSVILDGTTQPGWAGRPVVTLDGRGAGAAANGLVLLADTNAVRGLTVTGFAGSGVVADAFGTAVQGNFLVGNGLDGATVVGNHCGVGGNLLSGNGRSGLVLLGADECTVSGNRIGTNAAGDAALPNAFDGITAVGISASPATPTAANLISGNGRSGVVLISSSEDTLSGNTIGTNAAGTAAIPNGTDGVTVLGAVAGSDGPALIVGGDGPGQGNLISGNGRSGVYVGGGGSGTFVLNCRIGTNADGTAALGNTLEGITIDHAGGSVDGNLISGNGRVGVLVGGPGGGVTIVGNNVGTNAAGTAALGNALGGLFVYVGATAFIDFRDLNTGATAPNVVSGNGGNGITLMTGTSTIPGAAVLGCRIGTNAAGTAALPNAGDGIALLDGAVDNFVGGSGPAANLISGNAGNGVRLAGADTTENLIELNQIGLASDGSPLGNAGHGVLVTGGAHDTMIGGRSEEHNLPPDGSANVIAFNGGDGVRVESGTGDAVLGNSIHDNGGLGIDLLGGANHGQSAPVITGFAAGANGGTDVSFTLDSVPSTAFRVEFFANAAADPSGSGEGQTFLGFTTATTDAGGHVAATANVAGTVAAGQTVTATATNPAVESVGRRRRAAGLVPAVFPRRGSSPPLAPAPARLARLARAANRPRSGRETAARGGGGLVELLSSAR